MERLQITISNGHIYVYMYFEIVNKTPFTLYGYSCISFLDKGVKVYTLSIICLWDKGKNKNYHTFRTVSKYSRKSIYQCGWNVIINTMQDEKTLKYSRLLITYFSAAMFDIALVRTIKRQYIWLPINLLLILFYFLPSTCYTKVVKFINILFTLRCVI